MGLDQRVHLRLRERRLVRLVVTEAPVADHVDDDVLVELLAEREGELDDPHAGLGVVPVHVEDRRLHHLGDVGRVDARTTEIRRGGEPELVVDDDVDRSAHLVARHLGEVQRLGDHALARERGITVHEHREHLRSGLHVAPAVTLRPGHALDHRVDGLEVARVRRERHHDLVTGRRGVRAGRADVVLHVAGALHRRRVERALELEEDLAVALADRVHEHVEPAAVRGAEHGFGHAGVGGRAEQRVEHRDQALGAFEAEALLAQVLRVHEPFEGLGRVQAVEDPALLLGLQRGRRRLDPRLHPLLLVRLLDVHVLDADGAGVRVTQHPEDVAQGECLAVEAAGAEPADGKLAVEVPDGEAVVVDVELGVGAGLPAPEWVEVGDQVAAHAVHVHEAVDVDDLLEHRVLVVERAHVRAPARRLVRARRSCGRSRRRSRRCRAGAGASPGGTRRSRPHR